MTKRIKLEPEPFKMSHTIPCMFGKASPATPATVTPSSASAARTPSGSATPSLASGSEAPLTPAPPTIDVGLLPPSPFPRPPPPDEDDDGHDDGAAQHGINEDAGELGSRPIEEDAMSADSRGAQRTKYQRFYYYKRGQSTDVKEAYEALKADTEHPELLAELIEAVVDAKGKKLPKDYIRKLRTVTEEKEDVSEIGWLPWVRAAEAEGGEALLKEMIGSGTVIAKRNKKLPPESKIPYPLNQVVKHVEEASNSDSNNTHFRTITSTIQRLTSELSRCCILFISAILLLGGGQASRNGWVLNSSLLLFYASLFKVVESTCKSGGIDDSPPSAASSASAL